MNDINTLINTFYSIFDNRENKTIDVNALKQLFITKAIISKKNMGSIETMNFEEFITPRKKMLEDGNLTNFHEWEIDQHTFVDNNLAFRNSTYEKKGTFNGEPYSGKGKKFIQLVNVNSQWKIHSILWEDIE